MTLFSLKSAQDLRSAADSPLHREASITTALGLLAEADAGLLTFEDGARQLVEEVAAMI